MSGPALVVLLAVFAVAGTAWVAWRERLETAQVFPGRTPYPPQRLPAAPKRHRVRICGTELDGSYYFHCRTCNASGGATPDRAVAVAAGRDHGEVA